MESPLGKQLRYDEALEQLGERLSREARKAVSAWRAADSEYERLLGAGASRALRLARSVSPSCGGTKGSIPFVANTIAMPRFRQHYHEGPFDGHEEVVDQTFLEPDLQRHDSRTDSWHHYAIVTPLPDFTNDPEPYDVHYKHMAQFDPESDYVERVAKRRARGD